MAKAVISNRIMLNVEASEISRFDDTLTYEIPSYREDRPPQIIKNMKRVKSGLISIPVGRTDLIPKGYEIVDKRVDLPVTFPEFRFELRPSQQEVYDKIEGNAVINACELSGKMRLRRYLVLLLELLVLEEKSITSRSLLETFRHCIKSRTK
jgi:hypothetical protein